MKKILMFFIIINILCVTAIAAPDIMSPSVILTEQTSGQVLYEKGADIKRPIASVTKLMTAYLVMEAIANGEVSYSDMPVTSEKAFSMGGSQIFLAVGEKMSVDDLLKGVMVASGNDAAVVLAEHVAGDHDKFVALMNKKAGELGCKNTHFANTNGLPEENHYSTARDLAIISRELLTRYPDIKKYSTIWMDSLRGGEFQLANTNRLVYHYKGMTGLKTGFADDALFCLVGSAERDGLGLITVVLGAETSDMRFDDTVNMMDYGFNNFEFKEGIKKGEFVKEADVKRGKEKTVRLVAEKDYSVLDEKSSDKEIEKVITVDEKIKAPVEKGARLGTLTFKSGDKILGEIGLVAEEEVKKQGFFGIFADFFARWLGIE